MRFHKTTAALTLAGLSLSLLLGGCGKSSSNLGEYAVANPMSPGTMTYYFGYGDVESPEALREKMDSLKCSLNPLDVYNSMTYTEEMFGGVYLMEDPEHEAQDGKHAMVEKEALHEKFFENAEMQDVLYASPYTDKASHLNLTTFPVAIHAGPTGITDYLRFDRSTPWAILDFLDEKGRTISVYCNYAVDGNTVTYTPVSYIQYQRDEEEHVIGIDYTLSDQKLSYEFRFRGPRLTLSQGAREITLCEEGFSDQRADIRFAGYHVPYTPDMENTGWISAHIYEDVDGAIYMHDAEGKDVVDYSDFAGLKLNENGHCAFYWTTSNQLGDITEHFHEFVYFGGDNGFILTDGENVYNYMETSMSQETRDLNFQELSRLEALSQSEKDALVEKSGHLEDDLIAAFEAAGISAHVNKENGEIALDAAVVFAGDSAELTEDGKALLDSFMQVYTEVISGEAYAGFLDRTLVEGHCAKVDGDSFEDAYPLSVQRAEAVMNYCQSIAQIPMEAQGFSNSRPVWDENHEIDMDASRRVSFRFVIMPEK